MTFLWLVFGSAPYRPKLAAVGLLDPAVEALERGGARVRVLDREAAERALRAREVDAVVEIRDGWPHVWLEGSDPAKTHAVRSTLIM